MRYEYEEVVIPFEHANNTIGYGNNPKRIETINSYAVNGWRFVSSVVVTIWGDDVDKSNRPKRSSRQREVLTFEREVQHDPAN